MGQLAPIFSPTRSDRDNAVIAGFLLHYREGFLTALDSVEVESAGSMPRWQSKQKRYYQDAESVTRYLLWWTGYPVLKGEMWGGGYGANVSAIG